MADRRVDVLLVGGGVASATCAEELRSRGFEGSVLLVGREPDPPYERPPCSKDYLRGETGREDTYLKPEAWWGEHGVELLTRTSVLRLDPEARVARLSTKEEVEYGQALIATGANVRRLPVDGAQLDGIHYLRALGNADAIRSDAAQAPGDDVVVVGGSYLGTELAASLTQLGKRVTCLMLEDVPLEKAYGRTAGGWFASVLEERGVAFAGGDCLAAFVGPEEGRVTAVRTEGGAELPAGLVVVAAGAVPDTMLAKQSGLEIGPTGGLRCDAALRVVGADGLWAAGDMCEWDSPLHGEPARVEHWEVAAAHGRTAAAGIAGAPTEHTEVPYFWSDIADWASSEYVGAMPADGWDDEVVRGSLDDGAFSVWFLAQGRVVATLSVGRSGDLDEGRRLISSREVVDPVALAAG